jgi:putative oxidoreductase
MFKSLENRYEFAALPLRLGLAALFITTGILQLIDTAGTASYLKGLGIPAALVFAIILMVSELVGGIFLLFGLLTRLTAIWMTIVVLAFGIMAYGVNYQAGMLTDIMRQLAVMGGTVCLMLSGPGRLSLDEKYLWE